MEGFDLIFYLLVLVYILVASRAYCGMENDSSEMHKIHFLAAIVLLGGMLSMLYLRLHGKVCVPSQTNIADIAHMFPGMKLRSHK